MLEFTAEKGMLVPNLLLPWHVTVAATSTTWGEQRELLVTKVRSMKQDKLCLTADVLCFVLLWPGRPKADTRWRN